MEIKTFKDPHTLLLLFFTPQISILILLTVYHIVLVMLV